MKIDINISFDNGEKEDFKKWVEAQVMDIRNWAQNMLEYGVELNPPLPQQYNAEDAAETLVESKDEPETPAEEIKLEEVRAKLAALSQAGKQEQVKKLITKFGAKKLTEIPKDKYPELIQEAEAL